MDTDYEPRALHVDHGQPSRAALARAYQRGRESKGKGAPPYACPELRAAYDRGQDSAAGHS